MKNLISSITKSDIRTYLAIYWSLFSSFYIYGITFSHVPIENIRVVDTALGFVLGTIVATIVGYFFGSSKGSADKDELIKKGA